MSSSQVIPDSVISTDGLAFSQRHLPAVFRCLWGGQFISLICSQLSLVSFQLIAVTALQASAMAMGILTASQTAPYSLFGLFVGVLVDRRSRFAILMAADLLRPVIVIAAAITAGCGQLSIWLIDSGSYLVSAGCLLLGNRSNRDRGGLRHLERRSIDSGIDRENLLSSMKAGVHLVAKHPILRIFALWSAIWNFSWSAVLSVFVLHASSTLLLKVCAHRLRRAAST